MFQSTHPCGVRLIFAEFLDLSSTRFNPRTPAGCDLTWYEVLLREQAFQSTHPCGVRPALKDHDVRVEMFQSTHPCGVRQIDKRRDRSKAKFQSTHPCGVRPHAFGQAKHHPFVSIHAPLRGATATALGLTTAPDGFNPRTPAGCDSTVILPCSSGASFQSTHPCGVRLVPVADCHTGSKFQSTHPCGVRLSDEELMARALQVSIHAPLRGATIINNAHSINLLVSIHAPLRGATVYPMNTVWIVPGFQSTHPCGVRRATD